MNATTSSRLSPIALQILKYLATHPNAQDTQQGIADWWLEGKRAARASVEPSKALAELVAARLLTKQPARDGRAHFHINPQYLRKTTSLLDHAKPAKKPTPANARRPASGVGFPKSVVSALEKLKAGIALRQSGLKNWGFGTNPRAGFVCLFHGPAGTGKTLAAEMLARMSGLKLYRVDLSAVVSKYIGETEKNLARIVDRAERTGTILFFDEADALFGKRTDVHDSHDRYVNIETSYLLQRLENFDGITLLATNSKSNIDDAFLRRMHFVVRIPMPRPR